jgi:hypothetical protein
MIRSAVAYRANGNVLIGSVVQTTMGVGLEVEPAAMGAAPDIESTARALSHALAQSGRIVPHPAQPDWRRSFRPFLEAAGVHNLRAFMMDAKHVSIEAVADQLKLTPARNLGGAGGFEDLIDQALLLRTDDLQGAAATLLHMLRRNPS